MLFFWTGNKKAECKQPTFTHNLRTTTTATMGKNKRKGGDAQGAGGKKAKTDIHKVGKYLPGGFPIDPKMKGVLVTCTRGKEHSAGQEACDLLAEVKIST